MNFALSALAFAAVWRVRKDAAPTDRMLGLITVAALLAKSVAGTALATPMLAAINGAVFASICMVAVTNSRTYPLVMAGAALDAAIASVLAALGLLADPAHVAAMDRAASAIAVMALWSSLPGWHSLAKTPRRRISFSAQTGLLPPD